MGTQVAIESGAWAKQALLALAAVFVIGVAGMAANKWTRGPAETQRRPLERAAMAPAPVQVAKPELDVFGLHDWEARMMFLDNGQSHDDLRNELFQGYIGGVGQRCDSIVSALMGDRGEWNVLCAPGYRYRFVFDESGSLKHSYRIR